MKRGFTLVELLAVIVILGIILTITYNGISANINETKKKSFEISANNLLELSKKYVTKYMENNDFPEGGISVLDLGIKNNSFESGMIIRNDEGQIELVNVSDGNYCVNGTKNDFKIMDDNCISTDKTEPELKVKVLKVGKTSVQLMIKTQDSGSGIENYEYCYGTNNADRCKIVNKEYNRLLIKDVINITNLDSNRLYKLKVISRNGSDNKEIKDKVAELEIRTTKIEKPSFSISSGTYATNKKLKITYPEIDDSYVKGYMIIQDNKEEIEETVTTNIKNIDITDKTTVKAYIKKDGNIVVQNIIEITGIDFEGPNVNVSISDIDTWTKSKTIQIEAIDKDVGLALKPYSYTDGKSWVKDNKLVIEAITNLKIKARDRLGNINKGFSVNGKKGYDKITIEKIDNTAPDINLEVIEGEKKDEANDWYVSEKVAVKVTIVDKIKSIDENGQVVTIDGGIGIDEASLIIKINGVNKPYKKIPSGGYMVYVTKNGTNNLSVEVLDKLKNSSTETMVIKKDDVVPTISSKANPTNYTSSASNNLVSSYFNTTVGVSGQKSVNCTANSVPVNKVRDLGIHTRKSVICTITNNAGVSANSGTAGITFRYYYRAYQLYNHRTCTRSETYGKCSGHYHSTSHQNDHSGDYVEYHDCSNNSSPCGDCPRHDVQYDCSYYTYICPYGGLLDETTCYF